MVGMKDENLVHRFGQNRADLIRLRRNRETHMQEVFRIRQIIARVNEGLAYRIFISHRRQCRDFRNQTVRGNFALRRVPNIERVVIERRQCPDHAAHHRHRVGVAAEPAIEVAELLVDHRVIGHVAVELLLLVLVRQVAVQQQVGDIQEVGVLGEVLDRIPAVQQDAFVAVDMGQRRLA